MRSDEALINIRGEMQNVSQSKLPKPSVFCRFEIRYKMLIALEGHLHWGAPHMQPQLPEEPNWHQKRTWHRKPDLQ